MTVKKTVGPIVTKITGIDSSYMQETYRRFLKVASGYVGGMHQRTIFSTRMYNESLPLSGVSYWQAIADTGKFRFSVIYCPSDNK